MLPSSEPKGFPEGLGYISQYVPTWVIIQKFLFSNSYTGGLFVYYVFLMMELLDY